MENNSNRRSWRLENNSNRRSWRLENNSNRRSWRLENNSNRRSWRLGTESSERKVRRGKKRQRKYDSNHDNLTPDDRDKTRTNRFCWEPVPLVAGVEGVREGGTEGGGE